MGNYYDLRLRKKALLAYKKIGVIEIVAKNFNISRITLRNWIRLDKEGLLEEKSKDQGRKRSIVQEEHIEYFVKLFEQEPDLTQKQVAERFSNDFGVNVTEDVIHRSFKRLGITRKKKLLILRKKKQKSIKQED